MGGHAGVAHLLALHGANPSLLTAKKDTPLQIACAKGQLALFFFLHRSLICSLQKDILM